LCRVQYLSFQCLISNRSKVIERVDGERITPGKEVYHFLCGVQRVVRRLDIVIGDKRTAKIGCDGRAGVTGKRFLYQLPPEKVAGFFQ
jgi:hypothetical protein